MSVKTGFMVFVREEVRKRDDTTGCGILDGTLFFVWFERSITFYVEFGVGHKIQGKCPIL